jgi:hypothetical protein
VLILEMPSWSNFENLLGVAHNPKCAYVCRNNKVVRLLCVLIEFGVIVQDGGHPLILFTFSSTMFDDQ